MSYLDFENNRCEGWTIPMYQCSAEQFVNEIKASCKFIEELSISHYKSTEYRYIDGTKFVVVIDNDDNSICEIKGKCTNDTGYENIYYEY